MLTLNKVVSRRCVTSSRWAALSRPRRFVRRAAMAKYFVTGATGFIGGRVPRHLGDAGHGVGAGAPEPEPAGGHRSLRGDPHPGGIPGPASPPGPTARGASLVHPS